MFKCLDLSAPRSCGIADRDVIELSNLQHEQLLARDRLKHNSFSEHYFGSDGCRA
jgi:molybdopterin/thiamine biosynthesis adenylyltransferase